MNLVPKTSDWVALPLWWPGRSFLNVLGIMGRHRREDK